MKKTTMDSLRKIKEHEKLAKSDGRQYGYDAILKGGMCLNPTASDFDKKYFLQWNGFGETGAYSATYIVGLQKVETAEGQFSLAVLPKVDNLDYLKMFMRCYSNPCTRHSFNRIYHIDFTAEVIECDGLTSVLSPLVMMLFVNKTCAMLKKELKKNYASQSDSLNKVRGRILVGKQLTNALRCRENKVICEYQEFTADTIENRLIKKALLFCRSALRRNTSSEVKELNNLINKSLSKLDGISDDVVVNDLIKVKTNKLFRDYKEVLHLATIILRQYDFNISNTSKEIKKIPPFWIDMALLFEHYVGAILEKSYPKDIIYQAKGMTGKPDFLSKGSKIILDTKYIPRLKEHPLDVDIVRQLSGYSRDAAVLKAMDADYTQIVPCVFIYPDVNAQENVFSMPLLDLLSPETSINGLTKFYRIGVGVPLLSK